MDCAENFAWRLLEKTTKGAVATKPDEAGLEIPLSQRPAAIHTFNMRTILNEIAADIAARGQRPSRPEAKPACREGLKGGCDDVA
ncbi:hypothetical protein PTKU46_87490 [Paraburkholderia terrae]